MRSSATLRVVQPEWMDLQTTVNYACVSERLVRDWIHRPVDPLPASRVDGGKILISRVKFDQWLEAHPYKPLEGIDVDQIVADVMQEFKKAA